MKKKLILSGIAVLAIAGGTAVLSGFEAHVINVTAEIENGLYVPLESWDFGTVFPEETFDKQFDISLSDSFLGQTGCNTANLVVNGGFENPVVQNAALWDIFPSGTAGLGWTVEWRGDIPANDPNNPAIARPEPANLELHRGVLGPADEGLQYAELDTDWYGPASAQSGEPASVRIYQNIPTVPGRDYILSFAFSPRPNTAAAQNHLEVKWEGAVVATVGPIAGGGANSWTTFTLQETAADNSALLEFTDLGTADSSGTFLDDVSLVEVCEPRVEEIGYVVRQKPKCWNGNESNPVFGQVAEDPQNTGHFICENEEFRILPLLCPFLSKEELTTDGTGPENDGPPIAAFHGPLTGWDLNDTLQWETFGRLSTSAGDTADRWNIDFKVPCFEGQCAQDNVIPENFQPDPANDGKIFGCDLWLEAKSIDGNEDGNED